MFIGMLLYPMVQLMRNKQPGLRPGLWLNAARMQAVNFFIITALSGSTTLCWIPIREWPVPPRITSLTTSGPVLIAIRSLITGPSQLIATPALLTRDATLFETPDIERRVALHQSPPFSGGMTLIEIHLPMLTHLLRQLPRQPLPIVELQ